MDEHLGGLGQHRVGVDELQAPPHRLLPGAAPGDEVHRDGRRRQGESHVILHALLDDDDGAGATAGRQGLHGDGNDGLTGKLGDLFGDGPTKSATDSGSHDDGDNGFVHGP